MAPKGKCFLVWGMFSWLKVFYYNIVLKLLEISIIFLANLTTKNCLPRFLNHNQTHKNQANFLKISHFPKSIFQERKQVINRLNYRLFNICSPIHCHKINRPINRGVTNRFEFEFDLVSTATRSDSFE